MDEPRRQIPGVDVLLNAEAFAELLTSLPRSLVVKALRRVLDRIRNDLADARRSSVPDSAEIAAAVRLELEAMDRPSLRRVINATGIPLHTNLGRAPFSTAAREAVDVVARGYSNLEYSLERGERGSRHDHCSSLLVELTGAGGALVVNNNAAAVVLVLNELADAREVIVSRGELVEIGGSFRVPEIIAKSGARLVEVGATNRTHPRDYEVAIGSETGTLLKVHRSNFQQSGFVSEVDVGKLVEIGRRHGVPVLHDLGSGLLSDAVTGLGLSSEPNVSDSLAAGVDLITFSGDKLLGGPQAGVILGRADLIDRLRWNPLLRAVRVGKLTLAALEATLRLWRDGETARSRIPAMAMIVTDTVALRQRAERIAAMLRTAVPMAEIDVIAGVTESGGGSYPGVELETWALRITVPDRTERDLEYACRSAQTPVIGRVRDGALFLDPRTVLAEEEEEFIAHVSKALKAEYPEGE
ncbi:MAG: L-seryl-tRNA(Sec) selenium transferase [Gemmatimonadales bacterium]|jgi:L-seryl-tRNA(Ser) seleniumtransferase